MNDILLPIVQTINAYLSDYILVVLLFRLRSQPLLPIRKFGTRFAASAKHERTCSANCPSRAASRAAA